MFQLADKTIILLHLNNHNAFEPKQAAHIYTCSFSAKNKKQWPWVLEPCKSTEHHQLVWQRAADTSVGNQSVNRQVSLSIPRVNTSLCRGSKTIIWKYILVWEGSLGSVYLKLYELSVCQWHRCKSPLKRTWSWIFAIPNTMDMCHLFLVTCNKKAYITQLQMHM